MHRLWIIRFLEFLENSKTKQNKNLSISNRRIASALFSSILPFSPLLNLYCCRILPSKMAVDVFYMNWKIDWTEFSNLAQQSVTKDFITVCTNDVPCHWRVEIAITDEDGEENTFGLRIQYVTGPTSKLENVRAKIDLVKVNRYDLVHSVCFGDANFTFELGGGQRGWEKLMDADVGALQKIYGLTDSTSLFFRITLTIPHDALLNCLAVQFPMFFDPNWLCKGFSTIEDRDLAKNWDAKLISRVGKAFYCHQFILGNQSDVFDAMLLQPSSKGDKEYEYTFPGMNSEALRCLIEYFYFNRTTITHLPISSLLELADAAEQHDRKLLVHACGIRMWNHVSQEPLDCFRVIRFCDSYSDLKFVKYGAFELVMRNREKFEWNLSDSSIWADGNVGYRLVNDYIWYVQQRVESHRLIN